jgi:glucose/arabinose dehydrogenase
MKGMTRSGFLAALLVFAAVAVVFVLKVFGPLNGPSAPPPRDDWEKAMARRIAVPAGYSFTIFARDLGHPRLMQETAKGDLLVSGYRDGTVMLVKADGDGDGRSDGTAILAQGLMAPHGLVLEGDSLLVAEEDKISSYRFDGTNLSQRSVVLEGIPVGGHFSRTLKRGPDGVLYLSIGSSCNACLEDHPWRSAILRLTGEGPPELFAEGLRNTVGFAWQPGTGALYGVDNGRDNLGDDVPDDELNLIREEGHYGWPYVHGMGVADPALGNSQPPDLAPIDPVAGLGGHVAPLAILFPRSLPGQALITQHGSWNRSEKAGYRIISLAIATPGQAPTLFLTGCLEGDDVICRPVDIIEARDGSFYVSDDYAGAVYRIARTP